jgi:DEAD/DEAH box helicase domain-containing protein
LELSFSLPEPLADQIAHVEELPPRPATYAVPEAPMHPKLRERLELLGIGGLYSHQAHAYDAVMEGRDLVVVTGTNSGKTLCYNLPAAQMAMTEPVCKCLYLFPTKALAQDQLSKVEQILPTTALRAATYDGDTPKSQRAAIRRHAHVILTNPDMLHVGILPGHEHWTKFFKSLRLVVLDEMHVYRGVFGSNVGNVLRRLLRLCEWHRNRPQIVACSATIGNPLELFEKLTGRKGALIDEDGAPRGRRTFVFWNPPLVGQGRLSGNVATSEIVATLSEANLRTLAFNRARVSAELVLRYTRKRLEGSETAPPERIESYRAGYTPKERREIEQALFKGKLLALTATNAMELGVDVGGLDAVVMNGYPGTAASFWQQAGRAGRGTRDGIAIFVAHDDPLEQFLIRKPELLLQSRNESASVNPENPQILSRHLLCAAHERPLGPSELERFGPRALEVAEGLDRSGELEFRAGTFYYPSYDPPAMRVNIRGAGGAEVQLMLGSEPLGTMERWRALTSAHEGAIYLHRGVSYLVTSLDLDHGKAEVVPYDAPYYTQPIVQSVIDQKVVVEDVRLGEATAAFVGISVTDMVLGYRKKSMDGDTVLSVEDLALPPETYDTVAVRFDLPEIAVERDPLEGLGAVHALEHALLAVAPLIAGCDRGDLGSAWYTVFPDTMRPAVFVFDKTPGGVGLCEKLFDSIGGWIRGTRQLVGSCECADGCPGCLYSARCEANNEALHKSGLLKLLERMLR